MSENRVTQLQMAGYSDGEDLEMDQGGAYFDYVNRTVLGLGCGLIILMLIMLLCVQALDRKQPPITVAPNFYPFSGELF